MEKRISLGNASIEIGKSIFILCGIFSSLAGIFFYKSIDLLGIKDSISSRLMEGFFVFFVLSLILFLMGLFHIYHGYYIIKNS